MSVKPFAAYYLIKIARKAQQERKKSIGKILLPETSVFMTRNMQAGEIVEVGESASEYFPEAKIGNLLLVHHFIEDLSEWESRSSHLIDQDSEYNYYLVTAYEVPGKRTETYGILKDGKIVAHPEYIFVEAPPAPTNNLSPDEFINQNIHLNGNGLYIFKDWRESREEIITKMKVLKERIELLSRTRMNDVLRRVIIKMEEELRVLSEKINKRKLEAFKIVSVHDSYNEYIHSAFGEHLNVGDNVLILNMAAETAIEVNGKTYIVAPAKYCYGPFTWYQDAWQKFNTKQESLKCADIQ